MKILALLKWLPALLAVGSLAKYLSWLPIPGARVAAFFGAICNGVMWLVKWTLADLFDGFREPQRGIVRLICFLLVLGIGVYGGIRMSQDEVNEARTELAKVTNALREKDQEDERKAAAAIAARKEAERLAHEAANRPTPAAAVPAAAGVRPAKAVRRRQPEPSLFGSLFGD